MQHDHEQRPARALGRFTHRVRGTLRRLFTLGGPVNLVTIHHEGAGTPTNYPRGAAGGYTYWIGPTVFTWLRSVWVSYATLGFNHVSLDICISGDRDVAPLTGVEIGLIHKAYMDARARGYVTDAPLVRPHHFSPGSNTVCPGTDVWPVPDVWARVVAACRPDVPQPQPPEGTVMLASATNKDGRIELFALGSDGSLSHNWQTHVSTKPWSGFQPFVPAPPADLVSITVAENTLDAQGQPDGRLEVFGENASSGKFHSFQTTPGGTWSAWEPL